MIYGGKPLTPVAPSKQCNTEKMVIRGPGAYSYGMIAKQPGSGYKIRIRDMERIRLQYQKMQNENILKSIGSYDRNIKMIDAADKKHLYKRIKRMVDNEMKANEHLFVEECPKQELVEEDEKKPKLPRITMEEIQTILDESKKKKDEEERKIVEEKRLQHFIVNSDELRNAAVTKRQKEIADLNYKIIQNKEMMEKEQKLKKREEANLKNIEFIKSQIQEKEKKNRNILEQKQQFRNELQKQLHEQKLIRDHEKELKNIERKELIKLKEKLDEEEEFNKLERIKRRKQNEEEIAQFLEERTKLFSKLNEKKSILNTFVTVTQEHLTRDLSKDCEAKMQLRRDNERFMERDAMIKEERRKQNEEVSKILMKQIKEIEDSKLSVEREKDELRRKRIEEDNRILMEQLKAREALIKQQKEIKRKAFEESMKDRENYLKEEKELCKSRKQRNWEIRKGLNDQINSRKDIFEKQKMVELENHRKNMLELAEKEELLQKLLKQV